MNDCAVLESSQSHYVEPLFGAILSTTLISVSLLFFNWRMALAAIWPLPVAFAIVALASDVQNGLSRRSMTAKIVCEDGIQECMEAMPDLCANNAEERYLSGLAAKIRALESRLIQTELENIRIGRKDATDEEVIAAAKLANVDEFAEKLPEKLNSNIGENGCELSGGERQRISIAARF